MGQLVDGRWMPSSVITSDESGAYDRTPRSFLDIIEPQGKFQPESMRYHLYVSFACPWAHRTLIFRELKGLTKHIGVSVAHPHMLADGWTFDPNFPGSTGDQLYSHSFLYQLYQKARDDLSTSVTVPVLWDTKNQQIVNNESSQIIRIFNSGFNNLVSNHNDYYPEALREEIDLWNEGIYHNVNNGVYKAGFAKTQKAYEQAVTKLFEFLDKLESHLENRSYIINDQLTECDLRLIPTLLRFDSVYHGHFKCNLQSIASYPNLNRYTNALYQLPAIKKTTHIDHIKEHYYYSHESLNPQRIVPQGPRYLFNKRFS